MGIGSCSPTSLSRRLASCPSLSRLPPSNPPTRGPPCTISSVSSRPRWCASNCPWCRGPCRSPPRRPMRHRSRAARPALAPLCRSSTGSYVPVGDTPPPAQTLSRRSAPGDDRAPASPYPLPLLRRRLQAPERGGLGDARLHPGSAIRRKHRNSKRSPNRSRQPCSARYSASPDDGCSPSSGRRFFCEKSTPPDLRSQAATSSCEGQRTSASTLARRDDQVLRLA